ncbi:MAG: hypothetical protein ACRD17_05800 [Terriglobales bacterium]
MSIAPALGPDRSLYELRGAVRRLRSATVNAGGPGGPDTEVEFTPTGLVLSVHFHRDPKGNVIDDRIEHLRRPDGGLIETRSEFGGRLRVLSHGYDGEGRLVAVWAHEGDQRQLTEAFTYHRGGGFRRIKWLARTPRPAPIHLRVPAGRQLYGISMGPGSVESECADDGSGYWSALAGPRDGKGVLGVFAVRRGPERRLREEFSARLGDLAVPAAEVASAEWPGRERLQALRADAEQLTVYEYDPGGRVIRAASSAAGGLLRRVTTTVWNDRGDPAEKVEIGPQGAESRTRYEYEYDAAGNWTRRRMVHSETSGALPEHIEVQERTIEYY